MSQDTVNSRNKVDIERLYEHAKIANEEMGVIKVHLTQVSTDVGWLTRFFWVIATSSVGGLVTGILNLLAK